MRSGSCLVAGSTHERAAPGIGNLHAIVSMTTNRRMFPMKRSIWSGWLRRFVLAATLMAASTTLAPRKTSRQPIKIIIPFAAGGGGDIVGRAVGEQLAALIGQPVVIENIAGAGGTLGTGRAAKSPPDGYTLFVGTPSTHGTNVAVYPKLPYDAINDFEPIGLLATSPLMLITWPKLQVNSVQDLIMTAREKPGEIAYGSFGTGSINHMASELFQSMANIRTNHIPYRRFGACDDRPDRRAHSIHLRWSSRAVVYPGRRSEASSASAVSSVGPCFRTRRRSRKRAFPVINRSRGSGCSLRPVP